jgi:SAM-dependent methyltransferase
MYLKFWFKTLLYRHCPFRFGYLRSLDKVRDPGYVYSSDKHPVRNKHHKKGGWKEQKQGNFHYRDYENYEEYLSHQVQKFNEKLKVKGGFTNREIATYRYRFYHRFRHLPAFLPSSGHILCAGARQGTEVEVLHDLGFKNAYGIDLNPGPDNKFVRVGDFMKLDSQDSSLDMIYCNSLDHAFNLDEFFTEHARVIKPNGYALYDIGLQRGKTGAFEAVEWESEEAIFLLMLKYFKSVIKVETKADWKWILLQGKRNA